MSIPSKLARRLRKTAGASGRLAAIQILDGVWTGIFGVVPVLVIADLTQGTGRFHLTLGANTR